MGRKKAGSRSKPNRLLIVEDDEITRAFYQLLIEKESSEFRVTASSTRVEDAIKILAKQKMDAIILDLGFRAHMGGLESGPAIRENAPNAAILVVTQYSALAEQCRSWSDGYLLKQDAPSQLIPHLRAAVDSRKRKMSRLAAATGPAETPALTPAERTVVRLTADGMTAAQIATELGKSKSTIDNQIKKIYQKLQWPPGKRRKVNLAQFAKENGLSGD